MSSVTDPAKLKVVELRAELTARGLDAKGNKPVLVQRLKEALAKELEQDDESLNETTEDENKTPEKSKKSPHETDLSNKKEDCMEVDEAEPVKEKTVDKKSVKETNLVEKAKSSEEPESAKEVKQNEEVKLVEEAKPKEEVKETKPIKETKPPKETKSVEEAKPSEEVKSIEEEKPIEEVKPTEDVKPIDEVKPVEEAKPIEEAKAMEEVEPVEKVKDNQEPKNKSMDVAMEEETEESKTDSTEKPDLDTSKSEQNGDHINEEPTKDIDGGETKARKASRWAESQEIPELEMQGTELSIAIAEEKEADTRGDKRKHSPSPNRSQSKRSKSPVKEDEPNIDNEKVQLSWYDSDLHLQVNKDTFLSAKPFHDGAFSFIWAGVRATHGVESGKVCFEVKITEELKWEDIIKQPERGRRDRDRSSSRKGRPERTRHNSKSELSKDKKPEKNPDTEKKDGNTDSIKVESETEQNCQPTEEKSEKSEENTQDKEEKPVETMETESIKEDGSESGGKHNDDSEDTIIDKIAPHLIRIGWSLSSTNLQLGENKYSYGYESSGKFVTESQFSEYGLKFTVGDVVGAFINIDDETINFTYTVNGQQQPVALTLPKSELSKGECIFFPHVLSKNYSFELNLGSQEEAWFQKEPSEYVFLEKSENKVAGPLRPDNRSECEVIMMCGLPAAGKTHWVKDYVAKNTDKMYTLLGNTFLLEKMTVNGNPLKNSCKGRWNQVLDKLSKSLSKLIELAALRRRNYILDQTNIYPSAQRRKMRSFEGFKRRAVVVVVNDEEQTRRQVQQEAQYDKEVSDGVILEMKASMTLPQTCDFLDEVSYAELEQEEAKTVVQKYNAQGRDAGYGSNSPNQIKSRYHDNRNRWQYRREYRGGNYREQRQYNNRYERGGSTTGTPRHGNWHNQRSGGGGWGNRNDRRESRGTSGGHRDFRHSRGSRHQETGNRDVRHSGNFNRRPNQTPGRNQSGNWQQGGGSWNGGNQNTWSNQNQAWQNWNQSQGTWNNQYKQYSQQGYGQQQQTQQAYGSYANWNYYGHYAQNAENWNSQSQPNSTTTVATSTPNSQYNQQQQLWSQYAPNYTQSTQQQPVQK